ncbi:MAG: F0F1 ATP synthase subunit epsilon, partial [Oscillospiraceae bacterium]
MSTEIFLDIVSPDKTEFSGNVKSVMLSAQTGLMTVLPEHAPVVAMLTNGAISYMAGSESCSKWLQGGFMEFSDNKMIILADKV